MSSLNVFSFFKFSIGTVFAHKCELHPNFNLASLCFLEMAIDETDFYDTLKK